MILSSPRQASDDITSISSWLSQWQAVTRLRDAVAVLEARAEILAAAGKREWPISPPYPLIIVIDDDVELADQVPAR